MGQGGGSSPQAASIRFRPLISPAAARVAKRLILATLALSRPLNSPHGGQRESRI